MQSSKKQESPKRCSGSIKKFTGKVTIPPEKLAPFAGRCVAIDLETGMIAGVEFTRANLRKKMRRKKPDVKYSILFVRK